MTTRTEPSAAPPPDGRGGRLEVEVDRPAAELLDDPFVLRVRGAGPDAKVVWRARFRDDDGRVWRATAERPEDLAAAWQPAKAGTGPVAGLRSLRPVAIDVRAEAADGRAAARTLTRRLMADGVRPRRWRDGLTATLYLPAGDAPSATLIADATAGPAQAAVAALAGPLLASRGVLVLALGPGRAPAAEAVAAARERLSAVPMATDEVHVLPVADPLAGDPPADAVVLPPGIGVREAAGRSAARAAAWDGLLARLGARPRATG
ncbi:MAG: hypothetical protein QOD81_107 [Solirubrobacteraceae bacterium]|nr:hypothetical protein [Solirubrobacteraceae bacterium]